MGRKRRNNVYRHYMLQEETQTSTCLLCYKTLNSTHGSNLMNHLKFMHKLEYQQILALNKGTIPTIATPPRASPNSNEDDSNQSDQELEVDVDKFFSLERGTGRARCDICQASVEMKGDNLISHLKRDHPKILKPSNDDSDCEEQEGNLYQEVVYLYDSDSKSPKNSRPVKSGTSIPVSSQKPKVIQKARQFSRPSINVERERKRPRMQETSISPSTEQNRTEFSEELENFGKYVTCLMKTVPKDLCTQLQMEIINLIMTAKIRNMSKPDTRQSLTVDKLENVTAGPHNQPIIVNVECNKLDDITLPSPESNAEEITKTESI